MGSFSCILFWVVVFLSSSPVITPCLYAAGNDLRWDGHPFVMCFISDDGTRCNLGWAQKAIEMDFRFTIAVNQGRVSPTKLTQQELVSLYDSGFEIANHSYSHGTRGVPQTCEFGSLLSYFLCDDFLPEEAMQYFSAEIERDSLSVFLNRPLESFTTLAYPRHLHSPEIINALIDEGYIGARFGDNGSYSYFSNGEFQAPARNSWCEGISLFRVPVAHYATEFFGDHSANPPVHYSKSEFIDATQPHITEFVENGGIFAIYAHHYGDGDDSYGDIHYGASGMTDTDLEWMVDLVRENGGVVWTFQEALQFFRERSRRVDMDGDQVWIPIVSGVPELPDSGIFLSVSPNPFNAQTQVFFKVASSGDVCLNIYDLQGRKVKALASGYYPPGIFQAVWNSKDESGSVVASGVYLVQLISADKASYSCATLLK